MAVAGKRLPESHDFYRINRVLLPHLAGVLMQRIEVASKWHRDRGMLAYFMFDWGRMDRRAGSAERDDQVDPDRRRA